MISYRHKTFHYKKAQPNKAISKGTLQDWLKQALKDREVVMERSRQTGESDPTHLINYNGLHGRAGASGNLLGVEFLSFSKGQDPSALVIDSKAKELSIEQIALSAEGKEAVEGTVYFGVLGNHVVLAQSSALRVLHLEKYINWFLRETGALDENNYIGLVDSVPPKKAKEMKDIREVQVAGPVSFESVISDEDDEDGSIRDVKSIAVRPQGARWDAVKAFFGDSFDFPDTLSAEQIIDQKSLEVTLTLAWKQARDSDASDLLNAVASNLRHIDDEVDYKVISKSGTEITRDDVKQRSKPQKLLWENGRPKWDDIFPRMLKFLENLREAGTIQI